MTTYRATANSQDYWPADAKRIAMTTELTFNTLRKANEQRIGHFKNKHGEPAHTTPDGSDWTPAQWIQATFGELGEMAMLRIDLDSGDIGFDDFAEKMPKELADVSIYLDITAKRCFDITAGTANQSVEPDAAQTLMYCIAHLGAYANMRKKFDRGDITETEFNSVKYEFLANASRAIDALIEGTFIAPNDKTVNAHPTGVNLGEAIIQKFNEVSTRVGSPVWIDPNGVHNLDAAK